MQIRRQRMDRLTDNGGRGSGSGSGDGAGGDDGGLSIAALNATRRVLVIEIRAHTARPLARGRHVLTVVLRTEIILRGIRVVMGHRSGSDVGRSSLRAGVAKTVNVLAQKWFSAPAHGALERRWPVCVRAVLASPFRLCLFESAVHLHRMILYEMLSLVSSLRGITLVDAEY